MTRPPDYIVHHVDEKEVTVDWFFAHGLGRHRVGQFVLLVVGWFFAVLPLVITVSAIVNRNSPQTAWWSYREGFYLWDVTILTLSFLIVVFIIGFFVLYVLNRASNKQRNQKQTYDAARLSKRLELAEDMYANKFGEETFRVEQKTIAIEPYEDLETYELRDRYRVYGVD